MSANTIRRIKEGKLMAEIAKCGDWITDRNPTEEEVEKAGDTGFILCISGMMGNDSYYHAVIVDEFNDFYNGVWYIKGVAERYYKDLAIHGWMMPPEPIWDN